MHEIYKLGVVVGIVFIYSVITLGLGYMLSGTDYDNAKTFAISWFLGMCAFVALAIFALEKFGLWMG